MENELMKKALQKKKMDGLDLTIILGGSKEEPKPKDSELAPGEPDADEMVEEAAEEKVAPGIHAKAAPLMHEGLGEEEAEQVVDPKIHEKIMKMMGDSSYRSSPLVKKAFSKK